MSNKRRPSGGEHVLHKLFFLCLHPVAIKPVAIMRFNNGGWTPFILLVAVCTIRGRCSTIAECGKRARRPRWSGIVIEIWSLRFMTFDEAHMQEQALHTMTSPAQKLYIAPASLIYGAPELPSSKYYTLRYVLAATLATRFFVAAGRWGRSSSVQTRSHACCVCAALGGLIAVSR